ncbi:MAG: hypothetical protein Q8O67_31035 [Deltaproteobacteria bacterium]|nr:hypothetical protein [Deltaproteobacteria bacterium]
MAQVIPESWTVPAKFRQRVGAQAGRQRAMIDSGHLLLILHEVPGTNEMDRSARLFWRAPDGSWKASGGREGGGLPVLKRHLESFQTAIQKFDEAVDNAVDKGAVQPEPFFEVITKATPVQRTTRNLHKALQAARDGVDDKEIITLRDLASDLERAVDNVVSDARNGLEFSIAKNAEAQAQQATRSAQAQHRLNLLAALFFPITAIGTIFGTQMTTGLEGSGPWLFWAMVASAFAIGLLVRSGVSAR